MSTKETQGDRGGEQGNLSKGQPDDPRQANASGEPSVSGRSHGRVIDESGAPAGNDVPGAKGIGSGAGKHTGAGPKGNTGKVGEDLESGRQGTA